MTNSCSINGNSCLTIKNEATMKKTYMNPTLKVVVLKAKAQMLANSNMGVMGDYDSGITIAGRDFDFEDEE